MSKIQRFEDLKVWQHARQLCQDIFAIADHWGKDYRFLAQITAAAGSIMDNIAEGFERNGRKEFIQFLFISKGSCGEVRSQLIRALDFGYIKEADFERLRNETLNLSGEISGFIKYLRNTTYERTKYKSNESEKTKP